MYFKVSLHPSAIHSSTSVLLGFLASYEVYCLIMLIVSGFLMWRLHKEVYERRSTRSFPRFSAIYYFNFLIRTRRWPISKQVGTLFGISSLFLKEGMYGITCGPTKYLFVYNMEAVEFVLRSFTFLRKSRDYDTFRPATGDGLATSTGKKWHMRRKQIIPSLHLKIVDEFQHAFNKHAGDLVKDIDNRMKQETSIDVLHIVGLCTLGTVLETAVGTNLSIAESQKTEYFKALHEMLRIAGLRINSPWFWNDIIFYLTKEGKLTRKYNAFMKKFARNIVEKRKQKLAERIELTNGNDIPHSSNKENREMNLNHAIIDHLVNLHLKDNSVSLDELVEEVQTLIIAAHDTTALAVSWTLYLLGLHQSIQREVQEEIDLVLGDDVNRSITIDNLSNLKHLHCTLKEAMRLYPPGGMMSREAEEDTVINGCEVKKGTTVVILTNVLHRNPDVFPNPEEFIPDRFREEKSKDRHPFAYIPFSAGPRSCIGQRYGQYSSLTILATVLRHFNVFSVDHRDKIELGFEFTIVPAEGLSLKFTKREFLRNY